MQISLTAAERSALEEALKEYLSDLRMEIADTDAKDFRDRLKEQEAILARVLAQLRQDALGK